MRDQWKITSISALRKQREQFPTIKLVSGASCGGSSVGPPLAATNYDKVIMSIEGIGKQEFTIWQWNNAVYNTIKRSGEKNLSIDNLNKVSMRVLKIFFEELKKELQVVR